jgi:hypothetical protein
MGEVFQKVVFQSSLVTDTQALVRDVPQGISSWSERPLGPDMCQRPLATPLVEASRFVPIIKASVPLAPAGPSVRSVLTCASVRWLLVLCLRSKVSSQ